MPKTYKAFRFKQFNSQKKNLAWENNPYFHYSSIRNCLGCGKITTSLPQRYRLPGTHKGTFLFWIALVKSF